MAVIIFSLLCLMVSLFLGFGPIAVDTDVWVALALGSICGLIEAVKIEIEVREIEKTEKNQL